MEEADLTATTTSITTHRDFTIRTITLKQVYNHSYPSSIFHMIAATFKDILVMKQEKIFIACFLLMSVFKKVISDFQVSGESADDEGLLAVIQYHFTSWPDHGVPKFATSLISFIRRVQKAHSKESGVPLLVHCSAGVGRTGTFILLDILLERLRENNSLNVYECLANLRKRRVLMVQTLV